MQYSLPSKGRLLRFLAVFYVATALLFLGFYSVIGVFGPEFIAFMSVFWPTGFIWNPFDMALVAVGLAVGVAEPYIMEVAR